MIPSSTRWERPSGCDILALAALLAEFRLPSRPIEMTGRRWRDIQLGIVLARWTCVQDGRQGHDRRSLSLASRGSPTLVLDLPIDEVEAILQQLRAPGVVHALDVRRAGAVTALAAV